MGNSGLFEVALNETFPRGTHVHPLEHVQWRTHKMEIGKGNYIASLRRVVGNILKVQVFVRASEAFLLTR